MKCNIAARFLLAVMALSACQNAALDKSFEGKVKLETISLAPKVAGRIAEIRVKEGDEVQAGDTLALLSVPEVEAKVQQASGAAMAARSQFQMATNGATAEERQQVDALYRAAKEQFDFAQKSINRLQGLYADSLIPAQAYDEALAKYHAAAAQLQAATAKRKEVDGGLRVERINMARGQMTQAEGALREANTAYNERCIIAPTNMSIETIALATGELALPGYNLFVGYQTDAVFIRFTVPESQLLLFRKGNTYQVELPFANTTLPASLVSVKQLVKYANKTSQYPNYQLGESVYELKLVPSSRPADTALFDNFTALLHL